jgi:hypothetical protein
MLSAPSPHVLQPIRHASAWQPPKSLERKRRPRAVATRPLSPDVVAGLDAHACMQVEALPLHGDGELVRPPIVIIAVRFGRAGSRQHRDLPSPHRDGE